MSGGQPALAGALDGSKVPAAYVPWLDKAGAICPQVTAPLLAAQIGAPGGGEDPSWNPNAVSPAGAEGLAQFLPGTWPSYGRDDDGTHNVSPFNPYDAIMAMGRYDCALAAELAHVPGDPIANMLAGYNAGAGAVLKYGGVPPFPETQNYVKVIEAAIPSFTAPGGGVAAGASSFGAAMVADAAKWLGLPYVFGGGNFQGPTTGVYGPGHVAGFDCSGLVLYAAYQASGGKIQLPHNSDTQSRMGQAVPLNQLQPGDVVGIDINRDGQFGHIGIYAGNGYLIVAPHTTDVVKYEALSVFASYTLVGRRYG